MNPRLVILLVWICFMALAVYSQPGPTRDKRLERRRFARWRRLFRRRN